MGLLEEMSTYLGLDEREERQNLLDALNSTKSGKAVYMIGQRPLNSKGGIEVYPSSPGLDHVHFVSNSGKNFGFGLDGLFVDPSSELGRYELTDKYGDKKYDADLLEKALAEWAERPGAIEQTAQDLGLEEHLTPAHLGSYSLALNNCKHFASDLDYLYRLAGGKFQ